MSARAETPVWALSMPPAARARKLGRPYDEAGERQRLAAGEIRNHTWLPGRGELVAEPEGLAVGFPVWVERRQGSRATGPVLARSFDDDRRPVGHECVFSLPPKSFTISPVIVKDWPAGTWPTARW